MLSPCSASRCDYEPEARHKRITIRASTGLQLQRLCVRTVAGQASPHTPRLRRPHPTTANQRTPDMRQSAAEARFGCNPTRNQLDTGVEHMLHPGGSLGCASLLQRLAVGERMRGLGACAAVIGASAPDQAPQQRGSASARGANAGATAHIDRLVQRSRRAAMQYFGDLMSR
jgi:hypothetical protein